MANIFEAYEMTKKLAEFLTAAKFIYGERWETVKNETMETIKQHHEQNKTSSLLSSAIKMAGEKDDGRVQLVILAAIADHLAANKTENEKEI